MVEKMRKMEQEMANLKFKEANMREKLQMENKILREQLQQKDEKLATMASLVMEAIQCRQPSNSSTIYRKEQWLQFQIKTLAQYASLPFEGCIKFVDLCQHINIEDRAKLVEFNMHNMNLTI